ncbi:MAG: diphthine--ammonia ligase [Desulfurococcales archaeon]|nr:diphthine--ammonia ligase [Desulfurococcales archaeon]
MARFCALLSGGKDSNYALYRALMEGMEPSCILVVFPRRDDSWMFHTVNVSIAPLQAKAMGLGDKVVTVKVSGRKEEEVKELEAALARAKEERGFDTIVVGAIASRYQYQRIKGIADRLGVEVYAPLWGANQEEYLRSLVREGFVFIITRISTAGLPSNYLGKPVTKEVVEEIIERARRYSLNPSLEGGEGETAVIDAPHYKQKVCIKALKESITEFEHNLVIEEAWLAPKETKLDKCITVRKTR